MSGPCSLEEEVEAESTKDGKAHGTDDLPVDVPKLIEEHHLSVFTSLFNKIYKTGIISEEWFLSMFIKISKEQKITVRSAI